MKGSKPGTQAERDWELEQKRLKAPPAPGNQITWDNPVQLLAGGTHNLDSWARGSSLMLLGPQITRWHLGPLGPSVSYPNNFVPISSKKMRAMRHYHKGKSMTIVGGRF